MMRMDSFTKESERALAEIQMLYGAHIYSWAKAFPDAALAKGQEAYDAARAMGERSLEFTSAGGMAMAHADMGVVEEAERWLDRAAAVASEAPTPLRARLLESWRGRVSGTAGDATGLRQHLEQAIKLATDQGRPAARCEVLARLALEAARLGAERNDQELLALADRCAHDVKALLLALPGHPPWGAQADAALARVALTRGALQDAAVAGRAALAALDASMTEDVCLDVILPASDAILTAGNEEEREAVLGRLRFTLWLLAQRILNEDIRVRWFRGPVGHELTRLAGPLATPDQPVGPTPPAQVPLADGETALLRLLVQGQTNREIADDLGIAEESVAGQLAELFAKIGASSRTDATALALIGKLV